MSTITNETSTTDTTRTLTDPTTGEALATANDDTTAADGSASTDIIVTREDKDRR